MVGIKDTIYATRTKEKSSKNSMAGTNRLPRKGSNPSRILDYLLVGSEFLIIATIAPPVGAKVIHEVIRLYFRKKRFERDRLLRDLKNLQKRDLCDFIEHSDGSIEIVLAKKGKKLKIRRKLDTLKIPRPKRWDQKWRLVIFDVPHDKKQARGALRELLYQLGFYPLQKSVYIHPYPCEEEIDFVASVFGVRKYIVLLTVSEFEGEEKLRNRFGLM